jgi:hypothetical protein
MGPSLGIDVGAASSCITDPGEAGGLLEQLVNALQKLKKT